MSRLDVERGRLVREHNARQERRRAVLRLLRYKMFVELFAPFALAGVGAVALGAFVHVFAGATAAVLAAAGFAWVIATDDE